MRRQDSNLRPPGYELWVRGRFSVFQCFLARLSFFFRKLGEQSSVWCYCVQPMMSPYGSKYGSEQLHTNPFCRRFLRHRQRKLRITLDERFLQLSNKYEVVCMDRNQGHSPLIAPSLSNLVAKIGPKPFLLQIISGVVFYAQKENNRNARMHF